MRREVYISSNAFPIRQLDAIFATCDERHIDKIELGSGVAYDADARKKIIARSKRTSILLHNYIPAPIEPFVLNLASTEPEVLDKSIVLAAEALELSAEIGATIYGVHAGFAYRAEPQLLGGKQNHLPHVPITEASKIFIESIGYLSEIAKRKGVRLLVENNVLPVFNLIEGANKSYLVCGIEDSIETMRQVATCDVGLLVDLGHVKVTANALGFDPEAYLENMRKYVAAFHIHDNDGSTDQHLPSTSKSWYLGFLGDFPRAIPFTLETNDHLVETLESITLFTT